jgi:hypothetical protein
MLKRIYTADRNSKYFFSKYFYPSVLNMQTSGLSVKLKFKTAGKLESLEFTDKTKRCHIAEDRNI